MEPILLHKSDKIFLFNIESGEDVDLITADMHLLKRKKVWVKPFLLRRLSLGIRDTLFVKLWMGDHRECKV